MATEKQIKAAKAVYDTVIRHMDTVGLKYDEIDMPNDAYMVKLGFKGNDLPMELFVIVDADKELIIVKSPEFTTFSAENISTAAMAICAINDSILDGSYALDIDTGSVMWTVTSCFRGSLVGEETIHYLIGVSAQTVDEYNDKLMMLNMGVLDLDGFRKLL